jgi:hypothetical protein
MDEIWMRMASRYGHAWVSQYGPMPDGIAAAEWRETLAGLTATQVREGFQADALRGDNWPPSSPAFRVMCMGIPSSPSVRAEVDECFSSRGDRPIVSRFTRGVLSRINGYNYRNASGKDQSRLFAEAYERTREFVMEGGILPVEPVALIERSAPDFKPAAPEVAKAHLDRIADLLKTEPVTPHTEVDS